MKIVSGKYKGIKLFGPKSLEIRPTSNKLKKAIFSMIESEKYSENIINKNFLDVCAGTGSVGIEALSRGANEIYFIEVSKKACNLINKNINKIGISYNKDVNIKILNINIKKNVFVNLPAFDFIYIDPPYIDCIHEDILNILCNLQIIKKTTTLFLETNTIHEKFDNFIVLKMRKISKSYVYILKIKNYFL